MVQGRWGPQYHPFTGQCLKKNYKKEGVLKKTPFLLEKYRIPPQESGSEKEGQA
jgi:hypothetical protein